MKSQSQKQWRAELWQEGVMMACVECRDKLDVEREIHHYALMYSQDGPVEIKWKGPKA